MKTELSNGNLCNYRQMKITVPPHCNCKTHPIAPLRVEPALGTGSHVTVLDIEGPQIHVALLIRNKVAHIADTAYLS